MKVRFLQFLTTFTQLTARLKNFLLDWLLVLGLQESLVECALVCIKSEVILLVIGTTTLTLFLLIKGVITKKFLVRQSQWVGIIMGTQILWIQNVCFIQILWIVYQQLFGYFWILEKCTKFTINCLGKGGSKIDDFTQ